MFEAVDIDGSEVITLREFKQMLPLISEWGLDVADPQKSFKQADKNGKGTLDFGEFVAWGNEVHLDIREGDAEVHDPRVLQLMRQAEDRLKEALTEADELGDEGE